jgi:ribonuclease D
MFDLNWLTCLGVDIKSRICLTALGKIIDPTVRGHGMQTLCERHLKLTVDKTSAQSDWKQNPLPPKLLQHASMDVKVGMCLLEAMMPLAKQVSATSEVMSPMVLLLSKLAIRQCTVSMELTAHAEQLNMLATG